MTGETSARAQALFRYIELFLDEVDSRGRHLDPEECEALAELFVRIGQGNYRCEDVTQRLEALLAIDSGMSGKLPPAPRVDAELRTVREFRALLEIVRKRAF
jgi:hypothetical protein